MGISFPLGGLSVFFVREKPAKIEHTLAGRGLAGVLTAGCLKTGTKQVGRKPVGGAHAVTSFNRARISVSSTLMSRSMTLRGRGGSQT